MRDDTSYWVARQRTHAPLQAVGYRTKGRAFNDWIYRVRHATTLRAIDAMVAALNRPPRVLDAGSGTGFYVELWQSRGSAAEIEGLDVSPDAVSGLRHRHPRIRFGVAELGGDAALPVTGLFDVVEAFDVLYHITDDARYERAVRQLADLVAPGGFLVVTDNFPVRDVTTRPHVRLRSLDTYGRLLPGFAVFETIPQFLLMNVPSGIATPALRWPLVVGWELLTWPARWDAFGAPMGWLFAAADRRLLALTGGRTPSTKLVVFRRG